MKNRFRLLFVSSMVFVLTGCPTVEVIRYEVTDVAVDPRLQVARAKTKDGERERLEITVSSGDGMIHTSNPSASLATDGKRFFASFNLTLRGKAGLKLLIGDWAIYGKSDSKASVGFIRIRKGTDAQSEHEEYRLGQNWHDAIELTPGEYALGLSAEFDAPNFSPSFTTHIVTMQSTQPCSMDWMFVVTEQSRLRHNRKYP